ncbi:unnamed protein product [Notodromas monacha]|uniref:GP-PDE domain-containing protein n=1 Tax=Notodromas monacha TaxID=399045 RepID=A0A7R9BL45_9CRUS|nr:unnamed protein product [Notodromas monacha]CAG0917484.1 unnamed protein product [Notodromas monacha]
MMCDELESMSCAMDARSSMSHSGDQDASVANIFIMFFAAAIGGYVLSSFVLLRSPGILHRKKEHRFAARHISHRGGAGECTENTIDAYRRAVSAGTELLELDVHLTKDNQVVVIHDDNLLRLTGMNCLISELRYEELPVLKRELDVSFARGVVMEDSENRTIPRLKDVFEEFPDVPINVDIKVDNDVLIATTADLIAQFKREKLTVWGNTSSKVTEKCYSVNPSIGLLFSMRRVVQIVILFYCGLLPYFPIRETHLEIPMPHCFFHFMPNPSKKQRFIVALMDKLLMRRSLFEHLQKRGIPVYLWVLNDPIEWDRAFNELRVDGVMTDFPSKLATYLKQHNV